MKPTSYYTQKRSREIAEQSFTEALIAQAMVLGTFFLAFVVIGFLAI